MSGPPPFTLDAVAQASYDRGETVVATMPDGAEKLWLCIRKRQVDGQPGQVIDLSFTPAQALNLIGAMAQWVGEVNQARAWLKDIEHLQGGRV